MKIALVSLVSPVHNKERIEKSLEDYTGMLEENFTITHIEADELKKEKPELKEYDLTLVFVKSGGTENFFVQIYDYLPQPVYLLSTPLHNSLAASMEILTWIQARGGRGKIIHGNYVEIVGEINDLFMIGRAARKLSGARLGVIGKPSDWLIASGIKKDAIKENLGIEIVDVDLERVRGLFNKISQKEAEKVALSFKEKASGQKESDEEDLIKAAGVYLALKEIVKEEELSALTIRCFDLLTQPGTTGCLALSLLNTEGIIAGCEGDVPAAISMYLAYHLTGQLPFMANPNEIDTKESTIKFAHCTLPAGMVDRYIIRSHFESGIGVGIQGILPEGPVTVFKLGGPCMNEYKVLTGRIEKNLDSPHACRTQILIRLDEGTEYFHNNPLGNHHIIIPGNYRELFEKFFRFYL